MSSASVYIKLLLSRAMTAPEQGQSYVSLVQEDQGISGWVAWDDGGQENGPGLEKQRLLERVEQNGYALQHAAAELKADKEIVATAVAQNGRALQHAAPELQADR